MKLITGKVYKSDLRKSCMHTEDNEIINRRVRDIIQQVRERGDEALIEYTAEFDHVRLTNLAVTKEEVIEARESTGEAFLQAIRKAIKNIRGFHE